MRSPLHPDGFRAGHPRGPLAGPRQRSFEELDTPLHEVTFCAVDLETTGGSPRADEIVEIGAVKSRGGERLGTLQTFVRPRSELPVEIQLLTGIRPSMLSDAPPLPGVLPAFLEFTRGCVFVAHNARFDRSFLDAACRILDHEPFDPPVVDTAKLARRLMGGDVRNVKLATLAAYFRTTHTPCHRAFADAAACLEILWRLLERAAAYGVATLADLLEIQRPRSNPHFEKVRLARDLPRTQGVYLFTNARSEVIYVGKATNLRARVRSYFVSDERKRVAQLRAEADGVRVIPCDSLVEAEALEARLIERLAPRYNRRGVRRRSPVWVKLTRERHPRFSVVRTLRPDGGLYIGPFASGPRAKQVADTLAGLFRVRTCTLRMTERSALEPCPLYELGSCAGACTGRRQDVDAHDDAVERLTADLRGSLAETRHRLTAKLARLARAGRFEEAAVHRDAFENLVRALDRARRLGALAAAGRVVLRSDEGAVELLDGTLLTPRDADAEAPPPAGELHLPPERLTERAAVAAWLDRTPDIRLEACERPLSSPWPRICALDRLDLEYPCGR